MESKENIEQLFKNTFDNFEADVNPDAWMNIQNGLNLQHAANAGSSANHASTGAKLTASSSKLSVVTLIGSTAAIIGIIASVIYFSSPNENADSINQVSELKTIENAQPAVITENNNSSAVENIKNEKQSIPLNTLVEKNSTNEKELTPKETSVYYSSTNEDNDVSAMDKKTVAEVTESEQPGGDINQQINSSPNSVPGIADNSSTNNSNESEEANQDISSDANSSIPEESNMDQFLGPITNVITPNGDGDNDVFIIEGKNLSKLEVSIVDQHTGKIIHSWNNLHGFWDGRLNNGEPAKEGIYFYNIFARTNTGRPLSKNGTFNLRLK